MNMKDYRRIFPLLNLFIYCLCVWSFLSCTMEKDQDKILILSRLDALNKDQAQGLESIMKLAAAQNILIDILEGTPAISDNLNQYEAVVFFGDFELALSKEQLITIENYIKAGGGFMCIKAGAENLNLWPWYTSRYSTVGSEKSFLKVSHNSALADSAGNVAVVHNQEYAGGRVSILISPMNQNIYQQSDFADKFFNGLLYVIDRKEGLKYGAAEASNADKRFHRRVLHKDLQEGVKLAVADNGTIYYIERGGKIYKFEPDATAAGTSSLVGTIPVSGGVGNGLLGIALDPRFEDNNLIYLYYTPQETKALFQKVSRFKLKSEGLDLASEKVLLTIPYDKEDGHTGGALLFDDKGNLFISTGDNTDPHEANGFGPIDERSGRSFFDAQRTAGNTANLLGKILRIRPTADGTYTIPEGNLFTGENANERPEIYVMGCRNPYTMSYDSRTGYLYWGEVGPDAGRDSTRGSRGYDEINQTRNAGFYGWPYFTGENKAYTAYDFSTQKIGTFFNPEEPVNNSVNNTGSKLLPPAQPAFISYPYTISDKFPELGEGTRCAIAGPVYHYDPDLKSAVKFPEEYNNVLFIADWSRNWVMAVYMDENGNYNRTEPFMPLMKFNRPLDLKFGPDGALYMLEYGEPWGIFKTYGSLVRIEHNKGNRPPLAVASASDTVGAEPLTVKFSSEGSLDYDGDVVQIKWSIGGKILESVGSDPEYTFHEPGQYVAMLTVTDSHGKSSQDWINIKVGNSRPDVNIETAANQTFYWDDIIFDYQVKVADREDGLINSDRIHVSLDYLPEGRDEVGLFISSNEIQKLKVGRGSILMENSDCKNCHTLDKKALGPSLQQIAQRYTNDEATVDKLAEKVIQGGGGVWGGFSMSAHPQISKKDAMAIVRYILSLGNKTDLQAASLPARGQFIMDKHTGKGDEGLYIFTASYTDNGNNVISPLSAARQIRLRNSRVDAATYDDAKGVTKILSGQGKYMVSNISSGDYLSFKGIDLRHVGHLTYKLAPGISDGFIEVRVGSPNGPVISRLNYHSAIDNQEWKIMYAAIKDPGGKNELFFVFGSDLEGKESLRLDWISFDLLQNQTIAKAGKSSIRRPRS